MARRLVGSGAFVTSVVAHALLLGCGALLLSHSLGERGRIQAKAPSPAAPSEIEVELPSMDPSPAEPEQDSPVVPESAAALPAAGGGPLERHPDTQHAGRGGSRTATEAATNLASSIDPITLETDRLTHLDRSQVSRLHTAAQRRSWDDHRSTPNPMELTFLATGVGVVHERRELGRTTRGSIARAVPTPFGGVVGSAASEPGVGVEPALGSEVPGRLEPHVLGGTLSATFSRARSTGAQVLLARPWVMRARPALPTETRERPNDKDDSSEAVAGRVAALIHASTVGGPQGPGVGGEPTGGQPGRSGDEGMGSRTTPSGFGPGPDASNDPGIQGYIASLQQRVDDQLKRAFPDWAIEAGRSGHVIFEFIVLADGRVERVRLVRPSGIDEYDGNVLTGMRRIPSFAPLPPALGHRFLITMSYDALNRVVGREGPGPGGYGATRRTQ
jgi:TonB family protein